MTTPKASGPLWACMIGNDLNTSSIMTKERAPHAHTVPVRVIPGHGKVVPLELVEAILHTYASGDDYDGLSAWLANIGSDIDAAVKGAI